MKPYQFYGWLVLFLSVVFTTLSILSLPRTRESFLQDTPIAGVHYEDSAVSLLYYPKTKRNQFSAKMDPALRAEGFKMTKAEGGNVKYASDGTSYLLIARETGANPRVEVTVRRPANILEILFHVLWR